MRISGVKAEIWRCCDEDVGRFLELYAPIPFVLKEGGRKKE
jgi:hypothetical protein